MKTRTLVVMAGAVAVAVCAMVLTLIAFGVAGVLVFHGTDLMYVVWPSSLILLTTWHSTPHGIAVTAISVLLNCITYIAVALAGRAVIRTFAPAVSR